jgi:hypothetical protein
MTAAMAPGYHHSRELVALVVEGRADDRRAYPVSRDDGWSTADVSTRHLNDPKVRKLWRVVDGDVDAMARALVVHLALVLASWSEGRRLTVDESAPTWLPVDQETTAALRQAGLVDATGRLPKRSWESWHGPAERRRELARESGAEGNRRRWGSSKGTDREPIGSRSGTDPRTVPIRTDPSDRARARAAEPRRGATNGPTSLGAALEGTPLGQAIAARARREDG